MFDHSHLLLRNLDDALCPYVSFSLLTQMLCQVEHLQPSSTGVVEYRSTREGLATIVRSQGWRQLFAGLSINYIKVPRRSLHLSIITHCLGFRTSATTHES